MPPNNATFQWQKDGSGIPGATSVNYTASVAANYTVTITSNGSSTTYPALAVTENPKPIPDFSFNNNNSFNGTTSATSEWILHCILLLLRNGISTQVLVLKWVVFICIVFYG